MRYYIILLNFKTILLIHFEVNFKKSGLLALNNKQNYNFFIIYIFEINLFFL
jgi:hypothetical protein